MRGRVFKVFKEAGIGLTGSVAALVLNYVLLAILTRWLGPDRFGTFVLAQAIANVALLVVLLGLPNALDRFIPEYLARGERGRAGVLLMRSLTFSLTASAVVLVVLAVFSVPIAEGLFGKAELAPVLRLVALSIPFMALIRLVSSAFVGCQEVRYEVYIQYLTLPILKIAAAVALFGTGAGLLGWASGYALAVLGTALAATWFLAFRLRPLFFSGPQARVSMRQIIAYSWPLSLATIVVTFRGQLDILFLGWMRPAADAGLYRVIVSLVMPLTLVLASFARVYKPVISERIAMDDPGEIGSLYHRIVKWVFMVNGILFLALVLFGDEVVQLLFTQRYAAGGLALVILAAGRFFKTILGPEGMTLEAWGHTRLSFVNALVMVVVNVVLDIVLIPSHGVVGAAIAGACGLAAGGLAGVLEIRVLHGMWPFSVEHARPVAVLVVVGFAVRGIHVAFGRPGGWLVILFGAVLAALCIVGFALSRSFDDIDREVARRFLRRLDLRRVGE